MSRIRYLAPFLLLAGVVSAPAQPIVKINPGASECDVTPTTSEIFRLDSSGNVLITGTLGGTGCGGGSSGGGTGTVTFNAINPSPFPLTITSSPFQAGSGSATVSYSAAYATGCTVSASTGTAVPSGSGTCPAVTLSNTSCTGTGTGNALNCSASGSVSESTALGANITSCGYTLTATCSPGGVTSTASLSVTAGAAPPPPGCPNLAKIGTGTANQYWTQVTSTAVKFGDGTVKSGVDATSYVDVWSYPLTTISWPGSTGLTTRPNASVNQYFAEKFVVPTDGSVRSANWAWSGSGINSNMSMTIGTCPGDFGQTGTQLTTGCKVNQNGSSSGLSIIVASSQQASTCTLTPGGTYYLNILPMAALPVGDVSTSTCSGTCTPWLGLN